jgi:cytochrome P450
LGFGAGAHFCLGAALARLEATQTLTRLLTLYPDLTLTGAPVRWRDSTAIHGLRDLPAHL